MIAIVKLVALEAVGDTSLWLRFSDGGEGVRDFSDLIAEGGPMVEPLRDPSFFRRAFVSCGAPGWPNGFDLDAIALHGEMAKAGLLSTPQAAE